MNVENLTVETLFTRLNVIEKMLGEALNRTPLVENSQVYLTISEAADLLCKSIHTLYGMVSRREIPHIKKGNRLYFSKQELVTWLQEGERLPVALK